MSERNPVTSDDLRTAAKFVVGAVRKLDPELFGKRAYGLEWTRSETITHIAAGFFHYSNTLGRKNQEELSTRGLSLVDGSAAASTWQVELNAEVLALLPK
jgi:hypothetical protein